MSTTTTTSRRPEEEEEEETTRHLMGHPLPALINLPSTARDDTTTASSSSAPTAEGVDLFMLSLTSPVQVYCFSSGSGSASGNHEGLANFNAVVPRLKQKERQNQNQQHEEQAMKLVVFGLTLDSIETCERLKEEGQLDNLPILSDSSKAFSSALELPMRAEVQGQEQGQQQQQQQLKPLLLLFREGQVVRFESPQSDADVATCAMKMLRTEQEVERDWTLLREHKESQAQG